ncbi:hypothetical protein Psuf_031590 [Phytohabitans suffuscus]|uniref:Uncharacterized protein n=1 Tax=Phytohabitans suffuscus TaxID=624315 RepID=A0A6F8YID4_9ACTN|nr:hypothetical protein Psuf_031590 [Phytohabitans suffuscus]
MRAERKKARKAASPKKTTGKQKDYPDDGAAGVMARRRQWHANGPRRDRRAWEIESSGGTCVLTRAGTLERVTGIEPALSAWEIS